MHIKHLALCQAQMPHPVNVSYYYQAKWYLARSKIFKKLLNIFKKLNKIDIFTNCILNFYLTYNYFFLCFASFPCFLLGSLFDQVKAQIERHSSK